MKNHELENEPKLELPFEVPEEFTDCEENEDEILMLKIDLLRRVARMEVAS
jgi:hypothetical protein